MIDPAPILGVTPQQAYAIAVQAASQNGTLSLWWKAAIGFACATSLVYWLSSFGIIAWLSRTRAGRLLAFRGEVEDEGRGPDNEEKDAPAEAGHDKGDRRQDEGDGRGG